MESFTYDKLLVEAVRQFITTDYESVSMQGIADSLKIPRSRLYKYIKNKPEMLEKATRFLVEHLEKAVAEMALVNMPVKEFLRSYYSEGMIHARLADELDLPDLTEGSNLLYMLLVTCKKRPETEKSIKKIYVSIHKGVQIILEWGRKYDDINPSIDAEAVAFEIVAFIEGAVFLGSLYTEIDMKKMRETAFLSLWNRIKK